MRASEERFRFLARASNEVVWEWDLARDRIFWSDNLAAVVGHPPERLDPEKAPDLRGAWAKWDELIHPDGRERAPASTSRSTGGTSSGSRNTGSGTRTATSGSRNATAWCTTGPAGSRA
jgi:PAS domain-containing protein